MKCLSLVIFCSVVISCEMWRWKMGEDSWLCILMWAIPLSSSLTLSTSFSFYVTHTHTSFLTQTLCNEGDGKRGLDILQVSRYAVTTATVKTSLSALVVPTSSCLARFDELTVGVSDHCYCCSVMHSLMEISKDRCIISDRGLILVRFRYTTYFIRYRSIL